MEYHISAASSLTFYLLNMMNFLNMMMTFLSYPYLIQGRLDPSLLPILGTGEPRKKFDLGALVVLLLLTS